jgi:tryptophan halogenase
MVAAALAVASGRRFAVRVVALPDEPPATRGPADAESTLPPLRAFNALLGLHEDQIVRTCAGTFKLGTDFVGWRESGSSYIQPCGEFGATLGGLAFHQYLTRLRAAGTVVRPEEYCLAAMAARAGRFVRPGQDPASVLSTMTYALHLDGALYRDQLTRVARHHAVMHTRDTLREVLIDDTGCITALILDGGERVEADLFVDASGIEARLIGKVLGVAFEDWSRWLPCARYVSARSAQARLGAPLTCVEAAESGWMARVPLQGSIACSYAYDPLLLDDEAAGRALLEWMKADAATGLAFCAAKSGRRVAPWHGNCVAIGASAAFIEPLESTALHLTQSMIVRLLSLFPAGAPHVERLEYNRLVANELERARDLAIAHYATARRSAGEFWRQRAAASVPDTLAYKMAQYESRGKLVTCDEEPLPEAAWLALYLGQGIWPKRCEALAQMPDSESVRAQLARMRTTMEQAAGAMPPHAAFIQQNGLGAHANV